MSREGFSTAGMPGGSMEFSGRENWSTQKRDIPDAPNNLNRLESQKQFSEARKDELIKIFGSVIMATGIKSEKISNALKDVLLAAESSADGLSVLENLDNEYFSIESLASQSLDMDNEDAIVDLLKEYKDETDNKKRINISKLIEELR